MRVKAGSFIDCSPFLTLIWLVLPRLAPSLVGHSSMPLSCSLYGLKSLAWTTWGASYVPTHMNLFGSCWALSGVGGL